MKKLLNTLYVLSETAYLSLVGEAVEIKTDDAVRTIPLHTLESIVCFSYKGASPALMGKCAREGIALSFFDPNGRFLTSVGSLQSGNVLLRREQYRIADSEERSLPVAKSFLAGKLYNSKYVLLRAVRDHAMQVDVDALRTASGRITEYMRDLQGAERADEIRGIEGNAAAEYFGVFNELILQNKELFAFSERNRRPPLDPVNALLSFTYSLLTLDCASALQSVGLDPYVGFLHTDRPGRKSLAVDLIEELRAPLADRFVLYLINNKIFSKTHFIRMENGAVVLNDEARKQFLTEWQKRKKEELLHPFLEEKVPWGLVPYVQALLLSRYIRRDLDAYPPFFWK